MSMRSITSGVAVILWTLLILFINKSFTQIIPRNTTIDLPHDDAVLPMEIVQWWYWTGHLSSSSTPAKTYGFEVCVFLVADNSQLIQLAITDVTASTYTFNEEFNVKRPMKLTNSFEFTSNSLVVKGGNGVDTISANINNVYNLTISLQSLKQPAIHYNGEPHQYSFGGYTYYYSRTSMSVIGTLNNENISGTAWFDRQYGDLARAITQGWQWFAIELENNVQIMLFDFLGKNNEETENESFGSITDENGVTVDIKGHTNFTVVPINQWTSPHTGCVYPSGWVVRVNGESYTVIPDVLDQELYRTADMKKIIGLSPTYWEGKSTVFTAAGQEQAGKAYVELNGFCPKTPA